MLMYYAVEFFAPVIVTGSISPSRDLNVYAVSDLLTLIPNVSFVMEVYHWNSTTLEPANIKLETFDLVLYMNYYITKLCLISLIQD